MYSVAPSRLALVLSLVVLGSSLAVFGSVSGVVPDRTHEFAIEDGALVATTGGGQQQVLVEDVRTVVRIEISRQDGYHVVRTVDREPTAVRTRVRVRAQRLVADAETVGGDVPATDSAAYDVRRIPSGLPSDRAAVVGATPNGSLRTAMEPNESAFVLRTNETTGTVVFERREPRWSDDRVLVVVTPDGTGPQYSVVVNLRTETLEALVRLDGGDR